MAADNDLKLPGSLGGAQGNQTACELAGTLASWAEPACLEKPRLPSVEI